MGSRLRARRPIGTIRLIIIHPQLAPGLHLGRRMTISLGHPPRDKCAWCPPKFGRRVQRRELLFHGTMIAPVRHEVKDQLFAKPALTAQDVLAKLIASTTWGDWDLESDEERFWVDARELTSAA